MKLLNDKKALITGARKGIGRGIAYKLAEQGADIGINDYIDDEETRKTVSLVESLGRKCSVHIQDVSKKENIDKMIDDFIDQHGSINVLVNNAIMQPQHKPFFDVVSFLASRGFTHIECSSSFDSPVNLEEKLFVANFF